MGARAWVMCTAPTMTIRSGGLKTCRNSEPPPSSASVRLRSARSASRQAARTVGIELRHVRRVGVEEPLNAGVELADQHRRTLGFPCG